MERILFALIFAACTTGGSTKLPDADGDGYGNDDCDDSDPHVHPGAAERCNGTDDDCDKLTDEDDAVDIPTWYADTDGDGYGAPDVAALLCDQPNGYVKDDTDCDDGSASVNPAASESCNGVDDDCNGLVDDDALEATAWYMDTDGDGYGLDVEETAACEAPEGFASEGGDCDDSDADVHPGADESCDGVDEDCDGSADEAPAVDAPTWYGDGDDDGYGDPDAAEAACDAPEGTVALPGDCDDGDPDIHPDAVETCLDDVDQDCDGTGAGCAAELADADLVLLGDVAGDEGGYAADGAGDVDGDGFDDVLVGAYQFDGGQRGEGRAFTYLGASRRRLR
jgi:hypothetical protein